MNNLTSPSHDEFWMKKALGLAKKAAQRGEVPIAAIVVSPDGVISWAINTRERQKTPLGHAELFALHKASQKLGNWRLEECTLYVTLEPCIMCAGALQQSRIARVVYGASDPKGGAVNSLYKILNDSRLNHQPLVTGEVLANECAKLISDFFKRRRLEVKSQKTQKVYRRRASVVVFHKGKILGFHAVDPTSMAPYFFLPGGSVDPGETPENTAIRECLEETGYKIRILPETAFTRKYEFLWNGQINLCETVFYLGILDQQWTAPKKVYDADYHRGVEWMDHKKVRDIFNYHPDILWAVQKLFKTAHRRKLL